jgi:hypothetical protein
MIRPDVSQLNTLSQSYQTSEYILTDEKIFYYRFEKDLLEFGVASIRNRYQIYNSYST